MNIGDRWRVTVALWLIVLPCVGFADELSDLQRKAENGEVAAQHSLGFKYLTGEGVPQDYKQAVTWYRLAAEQGFARVQYNLGIMYSNGRGVPQDDKQAAEWFRLASEQGNESAIREIKKSRYQIFLPELETARQVARLEEERKRAELKDVQRRERLESKDRRAPIID